MLRLHADCRFLTFNIFKSCIQGNLLRQIRQALESSDTYFRIIMCFLSPHVFSAPSASSVKTQHICVVIVLLVHTLYASLLCLRLLTQRPSEQYINWAEDLV
jgi:hypothetical protein